ncbi:hypothetical protein CAPTEDRAFT_92989 [Capitella teleta]|uniref:Galactosyltransferase N-terminal domain-containing protein n=1 Tax=Capitella teleta TaxID=283909 RepID=R7TUU5_CAPTE|nr:hypothetical protein CAPTEDRAFT_129664 [Capitella teleta]ELU01661.1 hypothetical protein CAPTEDRAFT_92989 [Capitella teleta]|eukprot:ELT94785.1 hypothetical protein CAPTEDRAFT_129664 [Capitella teleta]
MDALSFRVKAIERLSKNSQLAYAQAEHIHKEVLKPGGHWTPEECAARQRVAMVVPYRNREDHLRIFVSYMHRFMQAQYLEYQIFVVEQASPDVFNRAALMNIGFLEALKLHDFDCFIFHDVDLLPLDTRQPYTCFQAPTHLGAYMSKFSYQMPYDGFFGGAVALSTENIKQMNGFSNLFYGWGGEDDDTLNRVLWRNLTVHRHAQDIGKSYMIKHEKDEGNPTNPNRGIGHEMKPDQYNRNGINSIKYIKQSTDLNVLYTRVLVSIGEN